ncbi:MAG: ABC transporter permease [Actinomycetota bacterium]
MTTLLTDAGILGGRAVRRTGRNPASVVGAVVFPLLFFTLFNIIMRRIMTARGFDYAQLLPPTIVVQAMIFGGMSSAYYVADDRLSGFTDRLRSLPVHRAAPILGRAVADAARAVVSLTAVVIAGIIAGFRFDTLPGAVGFFLLAIGFALALAQAFGLLGQIASSPSAAVSLASVPYLPLLMLSSGFVPVEDFPDWLEWFVRWQPVTAVIDALRALAGNGDVGETLPLAVTWVVGLTIVFGALGALAFNRRTT